MSIRENRHHAWATWALNVLLPGLPAAARGEGGWGVTLSALALSTTTLFWLRTLVHPLPLLAHLAALWAVAQVAALWPRAVALEARSPIHWGRALGISALVYGSIGAALLWGSYTRFGLVRVEDNVMYPQLLEGDLVLYRRHPITRPGRLAVVGWPDGAGVTRILAEGPNTVHLLKGQPVIDGQPLPQIPLVDLRVEALPDPHEPLTWLNALLEHADEEAYVVMYESPRWKRQTLAAVTLTADKIFAIGDQRDAALKLNRRGALPRGVILGAPLYVLTSSSEEGLRLGRLGLEVR